MCKFSSKSGGVPFQISFFLGDLTRNDPHVSLCELVCTLHNCIFLCVYGCSYVHVQLSSTCQRTFI